MKVFKKYFRVVLCFMAFALCSFMFAFTPSASAAMAVNYTIAEYKAAINAVKMPTTEVDYSKSNAEFKIPLLDNVLGNTSVNVEDQTEDYIIRVIDPSGYKHDYAVDGENSDETKKYFAGIQIRDGKKYLVVNAKNDGEYKVVYIVKTGSGDNTRKFYSNTYKVTVKNVSYELDFKTPVVDTTDVDGDGDTAEILGYETKLVKTKLQVGSEPYEIPVAYAKVVNGNVTSDAATIKVTKNNAPQTLNDTANKSVFTSQVVNGVTKYYLTPSEKGVYTIEYSYENSINRPTKTFTINVVDNFEASDLILVTKNPTFEGVSLGNTGIELPKLTFNTSSESNVDVNVKSIVIEKQYDSSIKHVLRNNNYTFDMTTAAFGAATYADMLGDYIVTYNVEDAYGTKATESFILNGITVSSNPTIALSYDYDATKSNYKDTVVLGAETELKAEYVKGNEIILPAVFVDDAVTTDFSKFTIVRTIRKGNQYYYIDNKRYDETTKTLKDIDLTKAEDKEFALYANYSGDTNIGDPTKAVKFKFNTDITNTDGTYYLEYKVISNEVKANREQVLYKAGTSNKYTFTIVSSHTETTPTITIDNLKDDSVKSTDELLVKFTAIDDTDTRLLNGVVIYTTEKAANTKTLEENLRAAIGLADRSYNRTTTIFNTTEFKNSMEAAYNDFRVVTINKETGSYDLDFAGLSGKVNVVAIAVNDDGNIGTSVKTLTLKDTTNDTEAPTLTINATNDDDKWLTIDGQTATITEFTVGQGVKVNLPQIYVNDSIDKELTLNVNYYIASKDASENEVEFRSPIDKSFGYVAISPTEKIQVINGGHIITSETGVYYVTYSATDVSGNTSVMYFTFIVEDTSSPVLTVEPVGEDLTQTGNTIEAKKGAVIDFETTLRSADGKSDYTNDTEKTTISVKVDTNGVELDWYMKEGKYVFNDYGTYTITVSGSYNSRPADDKVIRVVVKKEEIKWLGEFDVPEYAVKNDWVYLPDIAASNEAVVNVTVTAPGGTTPNEGKADKVTVNGISYWAFKTNKDSKGNYTVTYTATTNEDVLTKTFKIKVGDNVAPTMTFDEGKLTKSLVFDDKDIEYVVTVDKTKKTFVVKVVQNGKEYIHNINLKIKDMDDTNTENTDYPWSNLTYELTGTNVKPGETTSNSKQYFINGTGKYSLKITIQDSYENVRTETIDFKVVTESEVEEKKDLVVGVVLIVMSLILLAGVILFFTLTGKKGKKAKAQNKKLKEHQDELLNKDEKTETEVKESDEKDTEAKEGEVE